MACAGSIRLSEGIERRSSSFADEGQAAHELAAHCLRTGLDADRMLGKYVNIDAEYDAHRFTDSDENDRCFEIDEEMVESVQLYVDYVRGLVDDVTTCFVDIESKFDLTHVHDGMFGTGDAVVYNEKTKHLTVADFKYGRGVPVDPQENPQLLTYGVGAVRRNHNRGLSGVTLTVVQPRCRHPKGAVREWTTDAMTLLEFEQDLRDAAEATEKPDAPLCAGEHCRFCPAAAICPALREKSRKAAALEFAAGGTELVTREVHTMGSKELAEALREVDVLETYVRRVREYGHDEAMAGRTPPGWKLVAKRAIRRWKDEANAPSVLTTLIGLDDEDIWTKKLVSPAGVEKIIGKKRKAELEDHTVKQSSGAVLVPEDDARSAVKTNGSEFEAVN